MYLVGKTNNDVFSGANKSDNIAPFARLKAGKITVHNRVKRNVSVRNIVLHFLGIGAPLNVPNAKYIMRPRLLTR